MKSIVSWAVVALLAVGAHAETLDERLARGDIVVTTEKVAGSEAPLAIVRGVLDAPIDAVWDVVLDCASYKINMPHIADSIASKVEGDRTKGSRQCKVTAAMPFPISNLTSLTRAEHHIDGTTYVRTWAFLEGDYVINEGSWTLTPYGADGKKTLAVYRLHTQPKIALPGFVVTAVQENALPDMLRHVAKAAAARK